MIITASHLHSMPLPDGRVGACRRTAREWAARHGVDWTEFVLHGIDADRLVATGDPLALRLVEHAQEVSRG